MREPFDVAGVSESDSEIVATTAARSFPRSAKRELDPDGSRQGWQVAFEHVPADVEIDAEVPVDESIS